MLLRPGEIGRCCLLFAQAAPDSPIRDLLGAPSYTEPEAKSGCASEWLPADQILAFGTASMKNLALQQGSVSIFLSSTCLPSNQKMGLVLLLEKAKLGMEQRGPLMLRKAGMLHVENPWGFLLLTAEGFSIHCLHVLGIYPECSGSGKMQGSGKAQESLQLMQLSQHVHDAVPRHSLGMPSTAPVSPHTIPKTQQPRTDEVPSVILCTAQCSGIYGKTSSFGPLPWIWSLLDKDQYLRGTVMLIMAPNPNKNGKSRCQVSLSSCSEEKKIKGQKRKTARRE